MNPFQHLFCLHSETGISYEMPVFYFVEKNPVMQGSCKLEPLTHCFSGPS